MDELTRRNSPKTPNSEIPDAEILLPPFRRGRKTAGAFRGFPLVVPFRVHPFGVAVPADLFGLERTEPRRVDRKEAAALVEVKGPAGKLRPAQSLFLERIRCAGGVAFMARDCRDVLRELKGTL